ncbi:MAG: hypothetical protein M0C28_42665 [Candidatus Moduliflexus flocculans]|nr:hypothetical protein [Candidatus Moduliflexus flocculans]
MSRPALAMSAVECRMSPGRGRRAHGLDPRSEDPVDGVEQAVDGRPRRRRRR